MSGFIDSQGVPDPSVMLVDRRRSKSRGARLLERDQFLGEIANVIHGGRDVAHAPLIIEGANGTGKSALIKASCHAATASGMLVVEARCSEHETHSPYALARRLLAPSLDFGVEPDADDKITMTALHGEPVSPEQVIHVLFGLNTLMTDLGRVLLAVDDVHWADAESAAWLQFLSRRLEMADAHLVMSVVPRRPSEPLRPVDRLALEGSARVFHLQPLHDDAVTHALKDVMGDDASDAFSKEVLRVTGGNPFLLVSVIRELADRTEPLAASQLRDLCSPVVAQSVLGRLSNLPAGALDLVQATALLGPDADLRLAAAVAGIDGRDASALADAVAEIEVFRPGRPLNFAAPLIQSSVYGELPLAKRSSAHATAGQLLAAKGEPVTNVARHLLMAEPQNQEWIVTALCAAARVSMRNGDIDQARRWLRRADAEMSTEILSADLSLAHAEAELPDGGARAVQQFRRAAALEPDAEAFVVTGLLLVDGLWRTPEAAAVIDMVTSAPMINEVEPDLQDRARLVNAVMASTAAAAKSLRGDAIKTDEPAARSAAAWIRLYSTLGAASDPSAIAFADVLGTAEETLELLAGEQRHRDHVTTDVIVQTLVLMVRSGAHPFADRVLRSGRRWWLDLGRRDGWIAFTTLLAESMLAQGRLREADDLLGKALQEVDQSDPAARTRILLAMDEIAGLRGILRAPSGLTTCTRLGPPDPSSPSGLFDATTSAETAGRVCLAGGDAAGALVHFCEARDVATSKGLVNPAATAWRIGMSAAHLALGQRDDAEALAHENLALARQFGAYFPIASAFRCLASVSSPKDRTPLLEDGLAALSGTTAELERCQILIDLGSAHRQLGNSTPARELLRTSADLAVRMGATRLVSAARNELRATGARPRRLVISGTEALTPAERRVAHLAAMGSTNSAIAKSLFINAKTVESHLGRAYHKLGIKSRKELITVLAARADQQTFPNP